MTTSPVRSRGFAHLLLIVGIVVVIALVVMGGMFNCTLSNLCTSGDLAYSAKSLVAAVAGAVDSTPRVEIVRAHDYNPAASEDADTVSLDFLSVDYEQSLGVFDVQQKNINSPVSLKSIQVQVTSKKKKPDATALDAKLANFNLTYSVQKSGKHIKIPITSVVQNGDTYTLTSANTDVPIDPTGGKLYVKAYLYSPNPHSSKPLDSRLSSTNVRLQTVIASVSATSNMTTVPVDTKLAYSLWRPVGTNRKSGSSLSGYGWGTYDYTKDGKMDASDGNILTQVAQEEISCPQFKTCDINSDGAINLLDLNALIKYLDGTLKFSNPTAKPNGQILVSSTPTQNAPLLKFTTVARYRDVKINSIEFGVRTSEDELKDVISSVKLMRGSTVLATTKIGAGYKYNNALLGFSGLNDLVPKDTTVEYSIVAEIKENSKYSDGTTITTTLDPSGGMGGTKSFRVYDINGTYIWPTGSANSTQILKFR